MRTALALSVAAALGFNCLAATPQPSTRPAPLVPYNSWGGLQLRIVPAPPTTRPIAPMKSVKVDPMMPNALPPQYALPKSTPQFPWRLTPPFPSTRPSTSPVAPYRNLPDGQAVPPDWKGFEFNGEDVYVIPVHNSATMAPVTK